MDHWRNPALFEQYPRKRTCAAQKAMSAKGQQRTFGLAVLGTLRNRIKMRLGYFASTARGRLRQEFFHCMRERFGPLDIGYVAGAGDLDELRAVQLLVHFPHRCVRWILFANQK